jgi:hypothetical protein
MSKMQENFNMLNERVLDALNKTNLEETRSILSRIKTPTIVTGVGGSKVVAVFTSKILAAKNGIISTCLEPRDMLYTPVSGYDNVLSCSYSGTNFGVQTSFQNELNKYLLSSTRVPNITNITYDTSIPKEHSFISLAATIIPMTIMLDYYLEGNEIVPELLNQDTPIIESHPVFEIMSGCDTATSHTYLESTMLESSLAIPIVHDKYSFCHGRSTTSYHNNHSLIYFDKDTELDKLMLEELKEYYNKIVILKSKYKDPIIDDYYLTIRSMLLTKSLAEQTGKDLSKVEYSPVVKKLYKYQGQM